LNSKIHTLVVQTSDGIVFPLVLASPVTRFLAWIVDCACIVTIDYVCTIVLGIFGWISLDVANAVLLLFYFLISIGYGIIMEWYWRGQTIGKRLLQLRVMDAQGLRLQFSQIVIRNLLRVVDSLPMFYFVGGVTSLVNRRGQRLGDFAANTIVIRNPPMIEPDLDQLLGGKFNSFREHPHLAARLRQRASAGEAGIALQSLLRRDELDPLARVELLAGVAEHFHEVVRFPPEATDGITDEQYVRNVVDILFRQQKGKRPDAMAGISLSEQSSLQPTSIVETL